MGARTRVIVMIERERDEQGRNWMTDTQTWVRERRPDLYGSSTVHTDSSLETTKPEFEPDLMMISRVV